MNSKIIWGANLRDVAYIGLGATLMKLIPIPWFILVIVLILTYFAFVGIDVFWGNEE